jgi:hypothetical protein
VEDATERVKYAPDANFLYLTQQRIATWSVACCWFWRLPWGGLANWLLASLNLAGEDRFGA